MKVDFSSSSRYTAEILHEGLHDTLRHAGVSANEIDCCIIPEGNTGYLRDDLEQSGYLSEAWEVLEERVADNLQYVGNTGSPAVLLAWEHAVNEGRIKEGDLVMLLAIESSKWLFAGTVLRWKGK